ncbi:MAG: sensor histidine kinase [Verrucomicrobiota bacterium]|jgi:signal transduction histidine kinase
MNDNSPPADLDDFLMKLPQKLESRSRLFWMLVGLGFLALVGVIDYLTGYEFSFSVFYLLGIGLATWFLGRRYGLFLSVLSVVVSIAGDLAAGMRYSTLFIPIWNSTILLTFYGIVVLLLASLHSLHMDLENRLRQRTRALTEEMAERERLEKEILEISEREQRRIGRDLHDSLCQHLTGTALAGQVLRESLEAHSRPEAADARKIVELVEDGILLARGLARGIYPVDMEAEGLMTAFRELSANLTKWSKVACVFEHDSPVLIEDAATATHLYRIAQEAVSNAIRHGGAKRIVIALSEMKGRVTLTVEDDGVGLPEGWQKGQGLGTRIMAHRAEMIGGDFAIDLNPTGGTLVRCSFPIAPQPRQEEPKKNELIQRQA